MAATSTGITATLTDLERAAAQLEALKVLPQQIAERLGGALSLELRRVLGSDEEAGALSLTMDAVTREASERLRGALAPVVDRLIGADPDALPQLLEGRLTKVLTHETQAMLTRVLATDGSSPLMTHLAQGSRAVEELRKEQADVERRISGQISQLTQEVLIQRSTSPGPVATGRQWEQHALDDIARIATYTGDSLERTGARSGHGGARLGDGVLELVADAGVSGLRVAIECRTGGRRATREGLRNMVINRDAHAGLLLAERPEALPSDAEPVGLKVYWDEGLVVLHHDRSDLNAGRWLGFALRAAALMARLTNSAAGQRLERATLQAAARRIESGLARLRPLKACVTGAENELGKLRQHAGAMEAEIRAALSELIVLADEAQAA